MRRRESARARKIRERHERRGPLLPWDELDGIGPPPRDRVDLPLIVGVALIAVSILCLLSFLLGRATA